MKPGENYISIRSDLSDLLEKIDWARNNPDTVKNIIYNQEVTAKTCFTPEEVENQFIFILQNYIKKFNYKISPKSFNKYNGEELKVIKKAKKKYFYFF